MTAVRVVGSIGVLFAALAFPRAEAQNANMSFFITSVGKGDGANLGGLSGETMAGSR
jgi:hypothetical protein